ncbi:armadillo-type protein [Schizophyllum amplum]|uniref:Armadillo-type protein n=1 Tax=Schizophyllum amplum TaxID=97359 RepID=A0A550CHN1_9AGAR|nr:armadillo-type protein [Auriculariopsis ampla]
MFKGILPHKRVASTDFTMVTPPLGDASNVNGKENQPGQSSKTKQPADKKNKKSEMLRGRGAPPVAQDDDTADFDKLLDDLQIPPTLRPKLAGMDATVKAAMVKSSHTLAIRPRATPSSPPLTPRGASLRRAHSIESLSSPQRPGRSDIEDIFTPPTAPYMHMNASPSRGGNTHSRGKSFDTSRIFSKSQVNLASASGSTVDLTTAGKVNKDKAAGVAKAQNPNRFLSILLGSSSTELDIESVKKLRLMLRNESAGWTQEFLKIGGYNALMLRLNEILEVEWREEQHDDQILYELLRCFKALSTSAIGCFALRSSSPNPFVKLVALIYSDKRPGDVPSRQLIVELLILLFDLYPPSSLPSSGRSRAPRREAWETSSTSQPSSLIMLPAPHKNVFSLVRGLLLTPAPLPSESPATPISPHAFIESIHKPRIYKTYLQELSDVCRDYFWVFCHASNTIWVLHDTDESKVEKPRAPGGMTGGVEFEAMGYFTMHLRFLNTLAKCAGDMKLPKDDELSAFRFHQDLFDSGFERILLIARRASVTYYPTLHLELARYVAHAGSAGYELPWTVSRLIGLPPPALCKSQHVSQSSPTKRGMPSLPTPKKVDAIRMN